MKKNKLNLEKIVEIIKRYKMYLFCIIIIVLSIISIVIQSIDRKNSMVVNSSNKKEISNKIAVYITGEVKNPGVYYLEENSRLNELLDVCGGITENADIEQINLAKKLVDSDKITILKKREKSDNVENSEESTESQNGKVNINIATKEELMGLSGIGESTADKIIEYRKIQRFLEIEDIMNVSGVGKSKYDKIKEDIRVD